MMNGLKRGVKELKHPAKSGFAGCCGVFFKTVTMALVDYWLLRF